LDLLVELVLKNAVEFDVRCSMLDDNESTANHTTKPFRTLEQLAAMGQTPRFSDYLRVAVDYKAVHGHVRIAREQHPDLFQWMLRLKQNVRQADQGVPLSPICKQRIQLLELLGLSSEFFGKAVKAKVKGDSWGDDMIKYVVHHKINDVNVKEERTTWMEQQRSEYKAIKANCKDSFAIIQADFRCNLLTSCGVNMDL
jgi:hypothetical protein